MTRDDCIREIRQLASEFPDQTITRKLYREELGHPDSLWQPYFGTFTEYKSAAGLSPTRGQRQYLNQIGKHASKDHYETINVDRHNYAEKYNKPAGTRFRDIIVCSDVHDIRCDPFWRRVFVETVERVNPNVVVFGGDIFDLAEFGRFTVDPRAWDIVNSIQWCHSFFNDVREAAPEAELIFVEGNHEHRLLRHLAEASPAMRAVLSDLHGFTVSKLFGLDKFEINYIARGDLKTFNISDSRKEVRKSYWVGFNTFVVHHFPSGKRFGLPGVNGHHHKHKAETFYSPHHAAYEWHQLGSGCRRAADFCEGEQWSNGFAIVHVDTQNQRAQIEYIDIGDYTVVGGKWYERWRTE